MQLTVHKKGSWFYDKAAIPTSKCKHIFAAIKLIHIACYNCN